MKATPIELKEHTFRKAMRGYNVKEVEAFKELAVSALESAARELSELKDSATRQAKRLLEHEERETLLKETLTTAHRLTEDMKGGARKEAELIVAEAKIKADEVIRHAVRRAGEVRDEIEGFKKQRHEFEGALKALLSYHTSLLDSAERSYRKTDEEADKLKFLSK
ncbi:MAG: DivIVA domain-containing protein [Deltaproteobacteria bacterium]|nr:DivIVA domain-containing protein [Deltaproteobacteria bacterium]